MTKKHGTSAIYLYLSLIDLSFTFMKVGEGIPFWGFEKCQNTWCTIEQNAPSAGVSLCNCRNLGGLASTRLSRFLLSSSIAHQTTPIVSLNQGYGSIWTLWCVPSLPPASALSPRPGQANPGQPSSAPQAGAAAAPLTSQSSQQQSAPAISC